MGKVFKKARKVVAKFDLGHQYGKQMGLPDPSGDLFYGKDKALSPSEKADALAKTQNDLAQQQANRASQEAVMQAQAAAQALELSTSRAAVEKAVADQAPIDTSEVDIDVGAGVNDSTSRRRRFSSTSTNAGSGGPAIRI